MNESVIQNPLVDQAVPCAAWLFLHWSVAHVPDMPGRQHWRPQMVTHSPPVDQPAVLRSMRSKDCFAMIFGIMHVTIVLLPWCLASAFGLALHATMIFVTHATSNAAPR